MDSYFGIKESLSFLKTPNQTTEINNKIIHIIPNNNVYNLQGRKVGNSLEGLPKGVYIQNKKKQVVK
jgi:hypothetical protein